MKIAESLRKSQVFKWPGDCICVVRLTTGDRVACDEEMRRRSIERDVLTYVLERPAAKDTAEGVRHWWLRNDTRFTAKDVQVTLAALSEKGWLAVREMQGEAGEDALVYELNTSRSDDIRIYLAMLRGVEETALPGQRETPKEPRHG